MPCRYYGPGEEEAIIRAECDKVTRLLCTTMTEIQNEGALHRPGLCLPQEVLDWWEDHKAKDAKRKAAEAAALKKEMEALVADPVSREVLERVVRVVGQHAAAAHVLAELDRRLKAGENVCAYQAGNSFYVGPAPKPRQR